MRIDHREDLFDELIRMQRAKMLKLAKSIVPHVVEDDLLQPFDFPDLERCAPFRYEEGVMEGLLTARVAIAAAELDLAYPEEDI